MTPASILENHWEHATAVIVNQTGIYCSCGDKLSFQPKSEEKFNPEFADQMQGFKWCGYDQKEMRSMRDFALSRGWKPTPAPFYGCNETDHSLCRSHKPDSAAKEVADIICHWFSNGPAGTPNADILISALMRLAREGRE